MKSCSESRNAKVIQSYRKSKKKNKSPTLWTLSNVSLLC